jgi:hypothetical protein
MRRRSKTAAVWIGLLGGALGLQRFYLHGLADPWGWLMPWPTLAGLYGVWRMREFGQDDRIAWVLVPLLGLMLAAGMLAAIVHGLAADERWNGRHNRQGPVSRTGWLAVIGVVLSLAVGAAILMGTIAFVGQRIFEVALEQPGADAQRNSASPSQ